MTEILLQSKLEVIHFLPGRVRLKVPLLATDELFTNRLRQLLEGETWVKSIRLNAWAASVVINYDQQNRDVIPRLQDILEQATRKPQLLTIASPSASTSEKEEWSSLTLPLLAVSLSIASRQVGVPLLRYGAIASLLAATFPVAQRAFKSLFVEQKLNIDCLDLLAIIFSGIQGRLVTPALMITLHELGDLIRDRTARSTEKQTTELLDTIGRYAWVEREGKIIQIPSDTVILQEIVIVYPGEQIPVDGIVIQGEATIDQQQLTGESMPIVAIEGTYVYASTLLRFGQIRIRAQRVGEQTRAAASWELLQKAPVYDTRMANYAAKIASQLVIPSLTWAGLVWITTQDPSRVASILTLDFVTGIRVSLPTAFLGALNHTTRHGILIRSGRTLELLSEIDTIVFDKTGTLTRGEVVVVGNKILPGRLSEHEFIQLAASAEQRITHPLAEAITEYAQHQGIEILPREDWEYSVGLGMTAVISGKTVLIGSKRFLEQQGIDLEGFSYSSPELSLIYVACNGQFQGVIQYADPLRPESYALIAKIQQDWGMSVHLLTGDNQERASQVAHALNIPETQVYAEAFPEQKAKIVRDLHRSGRTVAFVGDGLNDSVALAYADVSISFAMGSEIARETADVVLMTNNLSSIIEAIAIAKQTKSLIEQNTLLVVGPNLLALGLASTVGLNPLLATAIHNGTAIAAGLNSLRPLAQHQIENSNFFKR